MYRIKLANKPIYYDIIKYSILYIFLFLVVLSLRNKLQIPLRLSDLCCLESFSG